MLLFFVLAGSLVLLWPAFFNKFPLLYPDSFAYVDGCSANFRSIGYYLFIKISSLGTSLWLVVFLQALITSYLLIRIPWLLLKHNAGRGWLSFLGLVLLVLLTDVSQYVSWIMPDIFTGWIFLISVLFFLSANIMEQFFLTLLLGYCFTVHNSNIFIGVLLIVLFILLKLVSRKRYSRWWLPGLKVMGAVVLGFLLNCLFNLEFSGSGKFQLMSRDAGGFFVAKLAADGVLSKTLKDNCLEKKWDMCKISGELDGFKGYNSHFFLWDQRSPFKKYYLFNGHQQGNEIILYAATHYPLEILKDSARDTLNLLTEFKYQRAPYFEKILVYKSNFKRNPRDIDSYYNTRQYKRLYLPARIIPLDDALLAAIALLLAIVLASIFLYQRDFLLASMVIACLLFILSNDLITASLSGPFPRYQMRVLWLLPYVLIAASLVKLKKNH